MCHLMNMKKKKKLNYTHKKIQDLKKKIKRE